MYAKTNVAKQRNATQYELKLVLKNGSGEIFSAHKVKPPPIAGPNKNPNPKAAPISAIPFERSCVGVMSEMYADAVEIDAPKNPERIRAIKSISKFLESAKNM